jgi:hypothetical protein
MNGKFAQVGTTILNLDNFVGMEELVDGGVRVHTTGNWHPEFHGQEAEDLRRFFAPAPREEQSNGQAPSGV